MYTIECLLIILDTYKANMTSEEDCSGCSEVYESDEGVGGAIWLCAN